MDGNRDLFWKLIEPEHRKVSAFCRKLTGNREDGDDLCQDALVRALDSFKSLRQTGAFRPWLYRIVVNTYKNRNRRSWWQRFTPLTDEIADQYGGRDPNPKYRARRLLERAFKAVTPEEQALVTLFEMDGWTVAELARLYTVNEGAIKVRLYRARRKMRARIAKHLAKSEEKEKSTTTVSEDETCIAIKPGVD
jgi:RNA polymerase sigma-70 factor (ECF subfamily)